MSGCGDSSGPSNPDTPPPRILPAACQSIDHLRIVDVGSEAQLKSALESALPGDLIVLADGVYPGHYDIRRSGSPGLGIGLCGSSRATIDVGSWNRSGIRLQGANYWTLSGFSVTNGVFAILAEDSDHNRFQGLTLHGLAQEGMILRLSSSHNLIQDNTIYDTGLGVPDWGEGIYIGSTPAKWVGGQPDRSDENLILNNSIGPGVTAEHIDVKAGSSNGTIRGNRFDGAGMLQTYEWLPWVHVMGNGWTVEENEGVNGAAHGFKAYRDTLGWGNGNIFSRNTVDLRAPGFGFLIDRATVGNIVRCDNVVLNAGSGFSNVSCSNDSIR
jgi:hypothetical protein